MVEGKKYYIMKVYSMIILCQTKYQSLLHVLLLVITFMNSVGYFISRKSGYHKKLMKTIFARQINSSHIKLILPNYLFMISKPTKSQNHT